MLKYISIGALLAALIASLLVFTGDMAMDSYIIVINTVSIIWFVTAPVWMVPELFGRKKPQN